MFNAVGYNVISSFLDSSLGKKLIVPYTNKKGYVHSDEWQNAQKFNVVNDTGVTVSTYSPTGTQLTFTGEQFDNGNNFASNAFTAPINGSHKFLLSCKINHTPYVGLHKILFYKNATTVIHEEYLAINSFTPVQHYSESDWVRLNAGEVVTCSVVTNGTINISANFYFSNTPRPDVTENDLVDVGGIMRDDLSLWQIFEGLVGCFNLYMLTNTLSKDVIIEPRDDFFNPITSAVDWTNKLDVNTISDEVITDPNQELTYGYKKDSNDKLMAAWEKRENKLLGDYDYDMPERFKVGKKRIGTKLFAPTYMGYDFRLCADSYPSAADGLINPDLVRQPLIPYMWADVPTTGEYPEKSFKFAPRLLLWLGDSTELTRDGELPKIWWDTGSGFASRYQYPKAVSYNNDDISNGNLLYADRWDNGTQIKGLFSSYFFNELQARIRGIKRTAKVYVTEKDIMMLANCSNVSGQLDFRNLIYLKIDNGNYWILSAIKDYEVGSKKLTTCEFIRWTATEAAPVQPIEEREIGGTIDIGTIPDLINEGLTSGNNNAHGHLIWTTDGAIIVSEENGYVNPIEKTGHPTTG